MFKLDEFVLDGTHYVSPLKTNFVKLGNDVNDGNVSNAIEASGTHVVEAAKTVFEEFKNSATGSCQGQSAKVLFGGVKWNDGKLFFNCQDNEELCKCLSATGTLKGSAVFESSKHVLKLVGDGEKLRYELHEGKRRRLLFMSAYRKGSC